LYYRLLRRVEGRNTKGQRKTRKKKIGKMQERRFRINQKLCLLFLRLLRFVAQRALS